MSIQQHEYPPDRYFSERVGITFTSLFVLLAVVTTAVEYLRVGSVDTAIPFNYPLYVGFLYIVAALVITRRFHTLFDQTKRELVDVLERTSGRRQGFGSPDDVSPEDVATDVNRIMDLAFHPAVVFFGGVVGGVFTLAVMWVLNVFDSYPYVLLDYAYGAGHGFYYGPIAGAVYFVYKIPRKYIVDIDLLDPDGVGGYRKVGDAIISLIVYGIFLITLDFVILSSVSFTDRPLFQTAVFVLYGAMLLFLLALTVFGVMAIRRRLLEIREAKTDLMRERFRDIETRYWEKVDNDEPPDPESAHIETMDTMFRRLHAMELWPINLASLSRLAFSVGSSAAVAAYKAGYIRLPI